MREFLDKKKKDGIIIPKQTGHILFGAEEI